MPPPSNKADAAFKMLEQHDYPGASRAFLALVQRHPNDPIYRTVLSSCFYRLGQHAAAVFHAQHALKIGGGDERVMSDAAQMLAKAGKPYEAISHLERACAEHPEWAYLRATLGLLYEGDQKLEDAERVLHESVAVDPHLVWSRLGLANLLAHQGRADEALTEFEHIIENFPPEQAVLENAAFVSNAAQQATPARVFRFHAALGRHFALNASELGFEFPATDDPDRPLRVAFVTHDCNNHAASYFMEPALRHLKREGLHVSVYYTGGGVDDATRHLASLPDEFISVPNMVSVALARRIFADKVDILIDTNGWTSGHRLHAFQTRPAPVQVTWLGYPNTTGLPAMDYRIVDSITDPPGAERFASEQLLRLDPCFLCYSPITSRPWIVPADWNPPARAEDDARPITFGSFNNLTKITDTALQAWARIVRAVPGSRLLVKGRGLAQQRIRDRFALRLTSAGVPDGCWDVMPQHASAVEHLSTYTAIDIALDTFPYNGTTTTCETLLMGVPLVTMRGDRHVSRVGASLLTTLGEQGLVAGSIEEYVDVATSLAQDRPRLGAYHRTLAARFLSSPICDGKAFADRLAGALRAVWRARCERGVGARGTM